MGSTAAGRGHGADSREAAIARSEQRPCSSTMLASSNRAATGSIGPIRR